MFLNYVDGSLSVNSYRKISAQVTDVADILANVAAESGKPLVARLAGNELEVLSEQAQWIDDKDLLKAYEQVIEAIFKLKE